MYNNNRNHNHNNNKKTVNLDLIYSRLKNALDRRAGYQELYHNLWSNVKKGNNRQAEISSASKKIGDCTHEINGILNELTKCKKYHKAMNMAHGYILSEINRTKKIIAKWQHMISMVSQGRMHWVRSTGKSHTDSTESIKYLAQKQRYLANLVNWDNSISRYLM